MVFSFIKLACTVLDETDEVNAIPFDQLDCGKTAPFAVFPMFVPSLSWQNDRFNIQMAQNSVFRRAWAGKIMAATAPAQSLRPLHATLQRLGRWFKTR
jgi:hypothetical protein